MKTASRFNLLARLMPRTKNPVIAELYTHVLNTPLLVEPTRAEALLNGYLHGDVDVVYSDQPLVQSVAASPAGGQSASGERIAVLNVSGALVSRPMPGPSGGGPQSYEELRQAFDAALADSSVKAIVFRMDSPGGFVAGCFDLTDHIFESRGQKPIVAVVDDMAYSAAYAIAGAADKIYVSRTGGVGSVGVIAAHLDQSEFDKQVGVKVTAIFAGERKNDFTQHEPLSDPARQRLQALVDKHYAMFVEAISRYRGLDAEAVRNTEAITFHGQDAIAAGFADEIGTLEDALAALSATDETKGQLVASMVEEAAAAERAAAAAAQAEQLRVKGVLAAAVASSGLPGDIATALLALDIAEADVAARIDHAQKVVAECKLAKMPELATKFVQQNTPLEKLGPELIERKAEIDRAIQVDARLPANIATRSPTAPTLSSEIYKSRREQSQRPVH